MKCLYSKQLFICAIIMYNYYVLKIRCYGNAHVIALCFTASIRVVLHFYSSAEKHGKEQPEQLKKTKQTIY